MREKVALGELCNPSLGQVKEQPDTIIDYIDISSVDNESKSITGFQTMSFAEAPSRARKDIKKNNIIVSTVRPNLNAVAVYEEETPNKTVVSTGFCVLDCKDNVDYRFVFNFCKSQAFIEDMVSQATGASYPAVSDKIVRSSMMPAYSYEEQCQISYILDAVSKIIADRKKELQKLDELIKARFVELFGEDVPTIKLGDVCRMINGDRGKNYPSGDDFVEDGVPFVNAGHLQNRTVNFNDMNYITEEKYNLLSQGKMQEGDILYCLRGSLGKHGLVDFEKGAVASSLVILRCNQEKMLPEFLLYALETPEIELQLKAANNGSSQPNLSAASVKAYDIKLPDIEEQKQFVAFVEQIDKSKFK